MKLQNVKPTKYDDLYTKEEAIKYLVDNLRIPEDSLIWECCSGEGNISRYLKERGFRVIETDIKKGEDFFLVNKEADIIITNPPYSLKDKILKRCFDLEKPFALLLPLTTLEGGGGETRCLETRIFNY